MSLWSDFTASARSLGSSVVSAHGYVASSTTQLAATVSSYIAPESVTNALNTVAANTPVAYQLVSGADRDGRCDPITRCYCGTGDGNIA